MNQKFLGDALDFCKGAILASLNRTLRRDRQSVRGRSGAREEKS